MIDQNLPYRFLRGQPLKIGALACYALSPTSPRTRYAWNRVFIFLIFICHRLSRAVYCLFELSDHAIDLFSQSSGLFLIRFILKQYSSSYSQLYDKAYLRNHPGHMTDIFNLRIEFVESTIRNHKRGKELLIMDYLQWSLSQTKGSLHDLIT